MNRLLLAAGVLGVFPPTSAGVQDAPHERTTLTAAEPHYVRGLLAALDRDYVAARYHWLRAVEIHPGHRATTWQRILGADDSAARTAMPNGELPASSSPYDARMWVLSVPSGNAAALDKLAAALRADPTLLTDWRGAPIHPDELDAAGQRLEQQARERPGDALLHFQLGLLASARGREAAAEAEYGRAVELDPELAMAWLGRGHLRLVRGGLAGARADLDQAVRLDPASAFAWAQRGSCRCRQGEPEGALEDLAQALALDPEEPGKLVQEGLVLFELGRGEEMLVDFARAHRRDPRRLFEHGPARDAAGLAALERRYSARLAEEPGDVAAYLLLGATLRDQGRLEEATAAYTRALVLRPELPLANLARAVLWRERGRPERALPDLDRAIEHDPRPARALTLRGVVHEALGDEDAAAAAYEAAIRAHPRFPWPYRDLGQLLTERDPERSLELLTIAVHLDPHYAAAYRARARTWTVLGNLPAAKNDARVADWVERP